MIAKNFAAISVLIRLASCHMCSHIHNVTGLAAEVVVQW